MECLQSSQSSLVWVLSPKTKPFLCLFILSCMDGIDTPFRRGIYICQANNLTVSYIRYVHDDYDTTTVML
jgi:hypothetical protein